jgi:hypothetical protein
VPRPTSRGTEGGGGGRDTEEVREFERGHAMPEECATDNELAGGEERA